MVFLPIAERELRVSSRKRSTFTTRTIGALVALVIGSGFFVLWRYGFRGPSAQLGTTLFTVLTWLCLAASLSVGLFFTSDCLSEEKREGTLGFLFLTDLRGYDVIVGKLLAASLRGFYALLAILPIIAITLLMGGVAGAVFWKTSLALLNALFVSLACGLLVSTLSRDSQKALAGTLGLLALIVGAGPFCDWIIAAGGRLPFVPIFSVVSPGYLFAEALMPGRTLFWQTLLVNQAIGWTQFAASCVLVRRTWQDKATRSSTKRRAWADRWKFGSSRTRLALRRKLLSVNPVSWLSSRERWQASILWLIAIMMIGALVGLFATDAVQPAGFFWGGIGGICTLMLYLGLASQSGRFFGDAKRSGLMELLLVTPLPARQIVQGQWRALLRMFAIPLALCLVANACGAYLQQRSWSRTAAAATPAPPPAAAGTNRSGTTSPVVVTNRTVVSTRGPGQVTASVSGVPLHPDELATLAAAVMGALTVAANLIALAWFGMWMGINSKSSTQSTLKTIVFVQVIPWFAISFASSLAVPLLMIPRLTRGINATQMMVWLPLISASVNCLLCTGKDIGFCIWSRRKLYSQFRERAAAREDARSTDPGQFAGGGAIPQARDASHSPTAPPPLPV